MVLERQPIGDDRGFLSRLFCSADLRDIGWTKGIAQINHTLTKIKGTVRGMHLQKPPHSEMKLVSCLRGKVWDVAVDLRRNSPTFLHWHAEILSAENNRSLLIPEGFAHGFQTQTNDCELLYFHSHEFVGDSELGFNPVDPRLGIKWPLAVAHLSERDGSHPMLSDSFQGIVL